MKKYNLVNVFEGIEKVDVYAKNPWEGTYFGDRNPGFWGYVLDRKNRERLVGIKSGTWKTASGAINAGWNKIKSYLDADVLIYEFPSELENDAVEATKNGGIVYIFRNLDTKDCYLVDSLNDVEKFAAMGYRAWWRCHNGKMQEVDQHEYNMPVRWVDFTTKRGVTVNYEDNDGNLLYRSTL